MMLCILYLIAIPSRVFHTVLNTASDMVKATGAATTGTSPPLCLRFRPAPAFVDFFVDMCRTTKSCALPLLKGPRQQIIDGAF